MRALLLLVLGAGLLWFLWSGLGRGRSEAQEPQPGSMITIEPQVAADRSTPATAGGEPSVKPSSAVDAPATTAKSGVAEPAAAPRPTALPAEATPERASGDVLAGNADRSEMPAKTTGKQASTTALIDPVVTEREAEAAMADGRPRDAVRALSSLLMAELAAPGGADPARLARWSERLHAAQREHRWHRRGTWPSREVVVQAGDSLISVRKRALTENPGLVVCTGQIARANQLDGDVIHPGGKLRIPLDRVQVLVDLDAHWIFYGVGDEVIAAWPVGVGKESSATQVGSYVVGEKSQSPMWFPKGRKPVPFGDPENPLGSRWIAWHDAAKESTRLGFHGTKEPDSIGKDASQGCIRMRTPDIEELYEILPVGAEIHVQP